VDPARVASARSKVGADPRAIEDELVLDVMIDLAAVFADAWRDLGSAREAELLTAIRAAAAAILEPPLRPRGARRRRGPRRLAERAREPRNAVCRTLDCKGVLS